MKVRDLIFFNVLLMAPTLVYGACSVANLTRCLDSVCAINIGANPAARCQYCGSSNAGEPTKSAGMKSISAGASAKYVISDKELKSAPTEPELPLDINAIRETLSEMLSFESAYVNHEIM